MDEKYLYIYNNLINYTRNKDLYKFLSRQDNFSDRLTLFLLHFSFFLKNYKNEENKNILQEIYDFNFRQLELSIREIGYGDQSINKKMKDYINLFHSMVSEIHFWDNLDITNKAPVFPAETTMSASFFLTLSIASHILVFFPLLAPSKGLSSLFTICSV